jgi:hypothetical protein
MLEQLGLRPRSLGTTDQPIRCPLDDVIRLLDQCLGAVILGYPQIRVTGGDLRGEPIETSLLLPTEWNHIEAGLAYARNLPLLVIHHTGVGRGIFDRGAIDAFLYQVNLSDSLWSSTPGITGALATWKTQVLDGRSAAASTQGTVHRRAPLSEDLLQVLKVLAAAPTDRATTEDVARSLSVPKQRVQYFLDQLYSSELIDRLPYVGAPEEYFLRPAGRAALYEHGLL